MKVMDWQMSDYGLSSCPEKNFKYKIRLIFLLKQPLPVDLVGTLITFLACMYQK